jgi:hypothetical protein
MVPGPRIYGARVNIQRNQLAIPTAAEGPSEIILMLPRPPPSAIRPSRIDFDILRSGKLTDSINRHNTNCHHCIQTERCGRKGDGAAKHTSAQFDFK